MCICAACVCVHVNVQCEFAHQASALSRYLYVQTHVHAHQNLQGVHKCILHMCTLGSNCLTGPHMRKHASHVRLGQMLVCSHQTQSMPPLICACTLTNLQAVWHQSDLWPNCDNQSGMLSRRRMGRAISLIPH